jgi:hypothetical protein
MSSTGWTGGAGGAHIGNNDPATTGTVASAATAKDQPEMATGVDLKGPPTRFPANKTPE